LAGATAAAAAALAGGTAATGLATALAASSTADPIFAAIERHAAAVKARSIALQDRGSLASEARGHAAQVY
jgi:hypothetical protein